MEKDLENGLIIMMGIGMVIFTIYLIFISPIIKYIKRKKSNNERDETFEKMFPNSKSIFKLGFDRYFIIDSNGVGHIYYEETTEEVGEVKSHCYEDSWLENPTFIFTNDKEQLYYFYDYFDGILEKSDITNVVLDTKKSLVHRTHSSGSRIGRGLVGGVLGGTTGAVIGATSVSTSTSTSEKINGYLITISTINDSLQIFTKDREKSVQIEGIVKSLLS